MSFWEMRQAIEESIPAWILLIPVGFIVLVSIGAFILRKK